MRALTLGGFAIGLGSAALKVAVAAPPNGKSVVILGGGEEGYREATSGLESALKAAGHDYAVITLPAADDPSGRSEALKRLVEAAPRVLVTAGAAATSAALEAMPDAPVVFFLVPNPLDASFMADDSPHRRRVAGVSASIAPEAWIEWIKRLAPQTKHLAVPHSPRVRRTVQSLRSAAEGRGLRLSDIAADKDHFPEAIDALTAKACDSVLMVLDAQVYYSATVQRLLLWGIRQKSPVWAVSANIVKAGAAAGLFCSEEDVGRQTAEIVIQVLDGRDISTLGLQYPRLVKRAVNARTADLIGISLGDKSLEMDTVRYGAEP